MKNDGKYGKKLQCQAVRHNLLFPLTLWMIALFIPIMDVVEAPFFTRKTKLSIIIYGIKYEDGEYVNSDQMGGCTPEKRKRTLFL